MLRIDGLAVHAPRESLRHSVAPRPASALPLINSQRQPVSSDQRGKFALVGLVVGAAAGWGVYAYQCTHGSDCYSPVGGILLAAAGGAVGLLVGLLIAPAPGSR